MQPLRVIAKMQDGRVATMDGHLPLDGLLAAAWMRRNHPDAYYNPSSHMLGSELIIPDLPLERRGQGDDWYWASSFNVAENLGEYALHWHKRFDDHAEQYIEFGKRRGRINNKSGKYKAYRMPLVIQIFDQLEWYAYGDRDGVYELLSSLTHIGKKTSQGLGLVDFWMVEPWHEDWSEVAGGHITRSLVELPEGAQGIRQTYGIRSPYWHRDNQRVCYVP